MTLDKVFEKLQGNLFTPLLFYIPASIIPEDKRAVLKTPAFKAVLNKIKYFDKKGVMYDVITTESLHPILGKATFLDKNMFLLLEQKRKLSTTELGFLLEKYDESLYFLVWASSWMQENLHSLKSPLSQEIGIYFEMQSEAFENHNSTFRKHFPLFKAPAPKKIAWSSFDEIDIPPLRSLQSQKENNELVSILKTDGKTKAKKVKKPPLITDEQAQKYLLETVFKVKI